MMEVEGVKLGTHYCPENTAWLHDVNFLDERLHARIGAESE
jgi:hypothetical protein